MRKLGERKNISNLCKDCSKSIIRKAIRCHSCSKKGMLNPNWKSENVGLEALHNWVKRRLVKPQVCRGCNQPKALDLANISQLYKRDLSDWEWLCRSCHMIKDGRIEKLHLLFDIGELRYWQDKKRPGINDNRKAFNIRYGINRHRKTAKQNKL